MDTIKQGEYPPVEIGREEIKSPETETGSATEETIQQIIEDKNEIDRSIEIKIQTLRPVLESLSQTTEEATETQTQDIIDSPERTITEIFSYFVIPPDTSLEEKIKIIQIVDLKTKHVKLWLENNKKNTDQFNSQIIDLQAKFDTIKANQEDEQAKNVFIRFFRKSKMKKNTVEMILVMQDISQINEQINEQIIRNQEREKGLKSDLDTLEKQKKDFLKLMIQQMLQDVRNEYLNLFQKLKTADIRSGLNDELLARKVLPRLEKLKEEGKLSHEEVSEYLSLLKFKLNQYNDELSQIPPDDDELSQTPKEILDRISREVKLRIQQLNIKSNFEISTIERLIYIPDAGLMDDSYNEIFDLLLGKITKNKLEEIGASLEKNIDHTLKKVLAQLVNEVTNPPTNNRYNYDRSKPNLDINKIPIDELLSLQGLERWGVIKDLVRSSDLVPDETLLQFERTIIRRIFDEVISPDKNQSWYSTKAVQKLEKLGSPEAIHLLLTQIESTDSNHTNNQIVYTIERLYKESDPQKLQQVLDSLPENKRQILQILNDDNSYMSRFGKNNSRYTTCLLLKRGELFIQQEMYTKLLEDNGVPKGKLENFYLLSGSRIKLLDNLLKVAELNQMDNKALIEPYLEDLIRDVTIDNLELDLVKRLSLLLEKTPKEMYDLIKSKLVNSNTSLILIEYTLESLTELAKWLEVEQSEFILEYFERLTYHINVDAFSTYILKKLANAIGISGKEMYDKLRNKISDGTPSDPIVFIRKLKELAEWSHINTSELVGNHSSQIISTISGNNPESWAVFDELMSETGQTRSEIMYLCRHRLTYPAKNELFKEAASPEERDYATLPLIMGREVFSLDEEEMDKMTDIYESKTLQQGIFEREVYLESLLTLENRSDGSHIIKTLLEHYQGAKDDPKRIRKIFQILSSLESLNDCSFFTPDKAKVDQSNKKMKKLEIQYYEEEGKDEIKKITASMKKVEKEIQYLTSLRNIEDTMTEKLVNAVCQKMGLSEEYKDKIRGNLEEFLKTDLFDIVPALLSSYQTKNEIGVQNLLKTITTHIIDGDFISWRYSHERSMAQLADLTEEQRAFWIKNTEPISIQFEITVDEKEKLEGELQVAKDIIKNAKEHILESSPDFDFTKERSEELSQQINKLIEKIKSAENEKEKKKFTSEKILLQAELTIINGVRNIEEATIRSFSRESILKQAKKLEEAIDALKLPLAHLDIAQIEKIFSVGELRGVTAYESDDPITLLKVGVEPQETCQSWRKGSFNECLLAYVADSNKKVVNVADSDGRIIARSIVKLTHAREEGDQTEKSKQKTLMVEKPYTLLSNPEVYRVFIRLLLKKADGLDSSLSLSNVYGQSTLAIFTEEAHSLGYKMKQKNLEIYVPKSMNAYEYSDTLGGDTHIGKIRTFDVYKAMSAITFEKDSSS